MSFPLPFFPHRQTLCKVFALCAGQRRSWIYFFWGFFFFFFWSHVWQSPIIEELGLLAIAITPPCQGPMRADGHAECFMEPTVMAEPELEVAGWNYLVLRLGVIKSRERPPDIIAGWAARLRNTWGFWKQSAFKGISGDFGGAQLLLPLSRLRCCSGFHKGWNVWFCYAGDKPREGERSI